MNRKLILFTFIATVLAVYIYLTLKPVPVLPSSAPSINVVDRCNSGKGDMVKKFSEWLMEKYRNMTGDYPALCPGFYVELAKLPSGYAGFAHFSYSGGRACVSLIQIACDMDEFSTKMALAHEFGHAMQATYLRDANSFSGWVVEAVPEAAATHIMGQVIQMPWHSFWFTKAYYTEQLYRRNPWDCRQGSPNYCEYKYSGAVGWLFERYGYRRIYEQFSYPNKTFINQAYVSFLLTPWGWPYRPDFDFLINCRDNATAYSGIYCYDDRPYLFEPGELLLMSNTAYANATFEGQRLLMAFAHTATLPALDATVTVRPCPNVTTVTATVTQTVPVTTTVTVTTTVPVTTTVTTTVPVTVTTTATQTVTATTTVTKTETITFTVPVTVTATYTTTQTVTYTVTRTVNNTVTETVTTTVPVTTTVTATSTSTTTVTTTQTVTVTESTTYTTTKTETRTETTTVTQREVVQGFDITAVIAIAVVAAILGCIACRLGRGAAPSAPQSGS